MTFKTGLAAVLLAASAFAADATLLNLVPAGTKAVAGFHVDRITNSPVGQLLFDQMRHKETKLFGRIEEKTGFDPRRHLREVLMVTSNAGPPAGAMKHDGLVVVQGTFDIPRILEAARTEGAAITNYKDASVITGPGSGHDGWVALLAGGIAMAGTPEQVKSAIDQRGQAMALDAKLLAKVQELSGRYDAWMVTSVPAGLSKNLPSNRQMGGPLNPAMLDAIEQASGGMTFGSSIEINGEAVTRTDKDATALADVLRFLAGMLQMNRERPEAAQFAKVLDSLEVKSAANVITLKLTIPQEQLEQMIKTPVKKAVRRAAR